MKYGGLALFLMLAFAVGAAQAQPAFVHSRVHFESDNRVDVEKARRDYDGNVFIFFYKKDHPALAAADSAFLANERISTLLNEEYLRAAIDVESDYARILFSQVEIGGRTDGPFLMLLNLDRPAHQAIYSSWGYQHPLPGVDEMVRDRMYWRIWNFAEYGTTEP